MNKKLLISITIISLFVGILCSQLAIINQSSMAEIILFPFSLLAEALRNLSLKSQIGNGIAIILYIVISCIPLFTYLFIKKRILIDHLLPILTVELFIILYLLINPQTIQIPFLSWTIDIFMTTSIFSYICLRIIYIAKKADKSKLSIYFSYALHVIVIAFVFIGTLLTVLSFTNEIEPLLQPNNISANKQFTYVILLLEHVVYALPFLFNAYITNECSLLLRKLSKQAYDESILKDISKISNLSYYSVCSIIIMNLGLQIMRILCLQKISDINITLEFPFFSIIFLLTILLLSKLLAENISLKKDNDLFI